MARSGGKSLRFHVRDFLERRARSFARAIRASSGSSSEQAAACGARSAGSQPRKAHTDFAYLDFKQPGVPFTQLGVRFQKLSVGGFYFGEQLDEFLFALGLVVAAFGF